MESEEPILLSDGYPRFISEHDIYDPVRDGQAEVFELDEVVRLPWVTDELLIDHVWTRVSIAPVRHEGWSIAGYEFIVNRGGVDYEGKFFPSTQDDTIELTDIRSQVRAYDSSGQKIVDVHFKVIETPENSAGFPGLYATDVAAHQALLSALTPLFQHIECESPYQPSLFE